MIDKNLLKLAKDSLRKEAYVPMTPEAMAAAQQPPQPPPGGDPNAGAGAPPMDPSAAGVPQMDPNAMPMDPNAAAVAPQMDPNAMPPADPSAVPPPAPAEASAGGQPIMLNLQDLQELFKKINDDGNDETDAAQSAGAPASASKRVTNKMISDKIDDFSQTLGMIAQALGIQPPVQQTGAPGEQPSAMPASPEDIQSVLAQMPPAAGAAPQGAPKQASIRSKDKLTKMIERLRAK